MYCPPLQHTWVPRFQHHKDSKVPTSFKMAGLTTVLATSAMLVAGPALTLPVMAKFAIVSTAVGGVGTYAVGK